VIATAPVRAIVGPPYYAPPPAYYARRAIMPRRAITHRRATTMDRRHRGPDQPTLIAGRFEIERRLSHGATGPKAAIHGSEVRPRVSPHRSAGHVCPQLPVASGLSNREVKSNFVHLAVLRAAGSTHHLGAAQLRDGRAGVFVARISRDATWVAAAQSPTAAAIC
jgi:hypothetical protein